MQKLTYSQIPEETTFSERRKFLVADENTSEFCLNLLPSLKDVPVLVVPSGESGKTLENCETIWNFLSDHNADRHSELISLGGGVLSDLVSFCASVFQRGIYCTLIPTTLLAMTDASIGGKTGINFRHLKNYIGSFYLKSEVIICPAFLKTLPDKEFVNGWAEIFKHCIILGQTPMKNCIEAILNKKWVPDTDFLKQSIQCKLDLVQQDPHDTGVRKKLNLGHTIAHALESLALENGWELSHGMAVFAGIQIESEIGLKLGIASPGFVSDLKFIGAAFEKVPFTIQDIPFLMDACLKDKKNAKGELLMVIAGNAGDVVFDIPVPLKVLEEALVSYQKK